MAVMPMVSAKATAHKMKEKTKYGLLQLALDTKVPLSVCVCRHTRELISCRINNRRLCKSDAIIQMRIEHEPNIYPNQIHNKQ